MPYRRRRRYGVKRRRARTPYRKRAYRKRPYRKRRKMVSLVSMHRFGWPKQARQTFKYGRRFLLTMTNGATLGSLFVRGNAPQDPEFALGGDNAYGWDEFMGKLYDRCYCYAAKITVTFVPINATSYYGGIHVRTDGMTNITTPELIMNQPKENYVTVTNQDAPKKVTRVINVRKWLPFANKEALATDSLQNPTQGVNFQIWVAQANPDSTSSFAMVGDYSIEYYCILGRQDIVPPSV